MKGLDRRLGQVERVARRRAKTVSCRYYDVSDLTPREQYELDTLLARAGAASPKEAWAQEPLTPEEQERLTALLTRVRVTEEGSADHQRPAGLGESDANHGAGATTGAGDDGAAPPTACSGRSR